MTYQNSQNEKNNAYSGKYSIYDDCCDYDECNTERINKCHVRQKIRENTIKLADCIAQFKLDPLPNTLLYVYNMN